MVLHKKWNSRNRWEKGLVDDIGYPKTQFQKNQMEDMICIASQTWIYKKSNKFLLHIFDPLLSFL